MKYKKTHEIKTLSIEFDTDDVKALSNLCAVVEQWFQIYGVAGMSDHDVGRAREIAKNINHAIRSGNASDMTYAFPDRVYNQGRIEDA